VLLSATAAVRGSREKAPAVWIADQLPLGGRWSAFMSHELYHEPVQERETRGGCRKHRLNPASCGAARTVLEYHGERDEVAPSARIARIETKSRGPFHLLRLRNRPDRVGREAGKAAHLANIAVALILGRAAVAIASAREKLFW